MQRRRILLSLALLLPCFTCFVPTICIGKRKVFSKSSLQIALPPRPNDNSQIPVISFANNTIGANVRPSTGSTPLGGPSFSVRSVDTPPLPTTTTENHISNDADDSSRKFTVLSLLWVIACLSALDRVAMSVALLPMSIELDWSDTTKGSISSLFSVGYGLCIIPAGLMVSSISPRLILGSGVAVWSLATILTPDATMHGMATLLLVRAFVGAGESVIVPSLQKLLMNWTTPQEKSRALAMIYSGFHVGTISAYLLSPIIMAESGWRGLFETYGIFGLVMLVPWLLFTRDGPAPLKQTTSLDMNNMGDVQQSSWQEATTTIREAPWRDFLNSKGTWAMVLAHCAKNWGLYTSLAWTPTFFAEQYHLDARESALLSVLPSILGAIGGVVAGTIADSMVKEDCPENQTSLRKWFQSIAFVGPAVALGTLASNIPEEPWLAQVFLMISIGLQSFNTAGFEAGPQEKAGKKWAGLLYSWTSLPAVVVGTTGVYVTGRVLDATEQDWSYVFGMNAVVNVLGAAAFVSLYDAKREFD